MLELSNYKFFEIYEEIIIIMFLQFLNFMRIDYLNSFLFISRRKSKFILIKINYMTRFLFIDALLSIIFENTIIFKEKKIVSIFEYFKIVKI